MIQTVAVGTDGSGKSAGIGCCPSGRRSTVGEVGGNGAVVSMSCW